MIEIQTKPDKVEVFHDALIQHGPLSNRIYLMKLKQADPSELIPEMEELAEQEGYTKIFAKVPASKSGLFLRSRYEKEASVPGFYRGREKALFLSRYLSSQRKKERHQEYIEEILGHADQRDEKEMLERDLVGDAFIRRCGLEDAEEMSDVYRQVFASYPFPISDPDYIKIAMEEDVLYFGVEMDGQLVSLASSEMNVNLKNVEFTDFATLPDYEGNCFAGYLLSRMEEEMRMREIRTGYTIARSISPGMNVTFAKAGYTYSGRLVNNTHISGQIQSMNIWHKSLSGGGAGVFAAG